MKSAILILFLGGLFLAACTTTPTAVPATPTSPPGLLATPTANLFAAPPTPAPSPTPTNTPTLTPTQTPDPAVLKGFERAKALGRGINIGNALEAPNEGDWGVTLQADYFTLIKQAGFQTVRIPIKWSGHAAEAAPYTIDPAFFQRIDWVVDQASQNGLNLIIDMHHYDEFMTGATAQHDRFLGMWKQIAEHYKDLPPSVYFELLNEPDNNVDPTTLNNDLAEAIRLIRASNPDRTLIVGPVWWNSIGSLKDLSLPYDEHNLIVTYHFYEPLQFTHQGAEFFAGADQWVGTTWTGAADQMGQITAQFDIAAQWSKTYNRPIFMGEFGTYHFADMTSRALWTTFVARQAEKRGFTWAYWDFCSGFGVYDTTEKTWFTPLVDALLPPGG